MLVRELRSTTTFRRLACAGLAAIIAAMDLSGASPPAGHANAAEASAAGADDPSHVRWPDYRTLELPAQASESPWYDLLVPEEVFGRAREDLGDLRLFDAAGATMPYALRVLEPEYSQQELNASEFNRATTDDEASELTLDLGAEPAEHNEVELQLPGQNFRRPALLEASDDGSQWRKLAERDLFFFTSGDREAHALKLTYPPSRFRYLRLRVERDAVVDRKPVKIEAAIVRHRVELPGEFLTLDASVGEREPVRASSGPGSAWILDLGVDRLPCERLEVDVSDEQFARDYVIEAGGPPNADQPFVEVARGQWSRKQGEPSRPLSAVFPEQRCARLRVVVTDYSNPPLNVFGARVSGAARQLVLKREDARQGPLRLYYGNLKAEPPHYDLERNLPDRLEPAPERLAVGSSQQNPDYLPEPKPFTERWPWLVEAVLATAGLCLAGIIVSLGRTAVARADAADEAHDASGSPG